MNGLKMPDLSILIPARNEMFLAKTIENIIENIEGDTEIIAVLDGQWADPPIKDHERVTLVYLPKAIGQRAATNLACRLSKAKYVMKVDAHCAFDKGFDLKMMSEMHDDYTMVPTMKNLHAFDWVCDKCGDTRYQSPTPTSCPKCDNTTQFTRDVVWIPKTSPNSRFFRFDNTLHFQYWNEYKKRPEAQNDVAETMSVQGSCFMLTREKYWDLDICDEKHGSWGQQGVEVACKTWLSGGKLMTNNKTWYAHMFRTQGGDFGFPYELSGRDVDKARKHSRNLWKGNNWPKAIHTLDWLLNKFSPVPGWSQADVESLKDPLTKKPSKGVVYYTDNQLNETIATECRNQIIKGIKEKHIVSVSLKPIQFGTNIHLDLERGYLTMAKQILAGLEVSNAEVIFFCEHDVLYHPTHFDFIPTDRNKIYYNANVWRVRTSDGLSIKVDDCRQLSGLVAYRDVLITHYRKRIELLENYGGNNFNKFVREMGFEPGTHHREKRVDDLKSEKWDSIEPNIDIRHDTNLTSSRWSPDQFRNKRYTEGWKELHSSEIPGWNDVDKFLAQI